VARGVLRIATTKIVGAVRSITVDIGYKPNDFALLTYGGGGGLVAIDVAHELSIPRVIVPPGPGAFSALGMLMADVQHDYSRTQVSPLDGIDLEHLEAKFREMEEEGAAALDNEGFAADDRSFQRFIDVRYLGQEHAVSVPVEGLSADEDVERLRQEFSEIHERQYGHAMTDPIEIVTLRSRAIGVVERPRLPEVAEREGDELTPIASREVVQSDGARIPYQVYDRSHFRFGDRIEGPAIIVEHTSTTVMHTGDTAEVGRVGEIVITLAEEPNHG
jgi:N-methylhydantoinase A